MPHGRPARKFKQGIVPKGKKCKHDRIFVIREYPLPGIAKKDRIYPLGGDLLVEQRLHKISDRCAVIKHGYLNMNPDLRECEKVIRASAKTQESSRFSFR
jgi:hypothetical protein